jgi:hypothetical protein
MPDRSFRLLLQQVVEFLNVNDDESSKLWNVLSALRGPDCPDPTASNDYNVKLATTSVIRHAIGLRWRNVLDINPDQGAFVEIRQEVLNGNDHHFKGHAINAFNDLGLKWNGVNEEKNGKNEARSGDDGTAD